MNLGIAMRWEVLQDKLDEGRIRQREVATGNTRRLPTRLTPGWTHRLYVACRRGWRGSFSLAGDVYWNPRDAAAPSALIFDPRRWEPTAAIPCPLFRGWRYLEAPPGGPPTAATPALDDLTEAGRTTPRTP